MQLSRYYNRGWNRRGCDDWIYGFPGEAAFDRIDCGGDLPASRVILGCADHWNAGVFSESDLITGKNKVESIRFVWGRKQKQRLSFSQSL